jgi:Dr1-associated corepressor
VPSGAGIGGLTYSPTEKEGFFGRQQSQSQSQGLSQPPPSGFAGAPPPGFHSLSSQSQQQGQGSMPPVTRRKRGQTSENDDNGDLDYIPESGPATVGVGPKSRKRKSDSGPGQGSWQMARTPGNAGPSLGIEVKTKFPVARIKRIMQADEDVGKVAQATPTAVCEWNAFFAYLFPSLARFLTWMLISFVCLAKALELFMINLVSKAAAEAKDRSSKRVTAAHLKQAVIKDQTFDFLQEIIEKVPDPTEKKGGRAASEDVDDGGGGGGPAKKKRAPRGRKKGDSDED